MHGTKRRKYFINKDYQTRFIFAFICVCLIGMSLAFTGVLYGVNSALENSMYKGHIAATSIQYIVLPIAVKTNMMFMIMGAVAVGSVSYYFADRTQEMVSGFRQGLANLREGRLDFCFDDESRHDFPELDAAFNMMLSKNRGRLIRLIGISSDLDGLLDRLRTAQVSGADERADVLRRMSSCVEELSGAVEEFRLDPTT